MKLFRKTTQMLVELRAYIGFHRRMTPLAKREKHIDRRELPNIDPGHEKAINMGVAWLGLAQDESTSKDGGVANFSLINKWSASYPETTGYIVSTMLEYAELREDDAVRERARKMLDWLVSIQFPEGGFQCGIIGSLPAIPVTFNTGQILIGLANGVSAFGDKYLDSMRRAADWLVKTQDVDGCWRLNPSPLTAPGDKAYETHVSWGLLEADRIESGRGYADAALANIRWAITQQNDNGWFQNCDLSDPVRPLTHTLGYVFRGLLEAYRYNYDINILNSCIKVADGCISAVDGDGFLPGRLHENWTGAVTSSCLTGSVQIAHCLLLMYQITDEPKYRDVAYSLNRYVRRTMKVSGPPETCGAIKGSFPVDGDYNPYYYPNWASKFFVDSNMLERKIREGKNGKNNF